MFGMALLERDASLQVLEDAFHHAAAGHGRAVLLAGEAGVGKTSLISWFAKERAAAVSVFWGGCDEMFTPRPLGPLHDMTAGGRLPQVATLLSGRGDRAAVFSAFLAELIDRPAIVIFEDTHWADEATLDLLRYLGRRVEQTAALIIITYRDDELGPRHPFRAVLGDLTSSAVTRLALRPLSLAAVGALAGDSGIDPAALHRQTGGNPFFITEILASFGGLPPTVRDAVLARAARLSPAARAVVDSVAIIGARAELPLLMAVLDNPEDSQTLAAIEECLSSGVLLAQGDHVAFRHDLTREALLDAILPPQRLILHRRTLAALAATPEAAANTALLAHHAAAAADKEAVLRYAPAAAREATAANAHRAAATLYELALRHADHLPPAELAPLLEAYAKECNLVDRRAEGVAVCLRAAALWRDLGQPVRQGAMLVDLANMLIGVGRGQEATRYLKEALTLLEAHPPGRQLAVAYRMQANVAFLDHEYQRGIDWAEKSIAVAETINDTSVILSARNVIGSALLFLDYERGCRYLESNIAQAHELGLESTAAHAYTNLGSGSCELYHLSRAERYLAEGIEYAAQRDLDRYRLYMTAWLAMTHLRLGRWSAAVETAESVLSRPGVSIPSRITALTALGLVRARRGEPEAAGALDEALELTRDLSSLHRVALVRAARAEAAWLAGEPGKAAEEAATTFDLAVARRHPWFAGELAYWLHKAGAEVVAEAWLAEPFLAALGGDWRAAAAAWERLRCPYETARALAGGDEAAQKEALRRFEEMGARPAADELRHRLQTTGATGIPRGPRPATRENPYGLTNRQLEILGLLAESLTNIEIAARLHLSAKTVDHHVSAILAKLDVRTRAEAAALFPPLSRD